MPPTSTLAQLAPQVQDRLQDPDGIFWLKRWEVFGGLAEAISELMLIVGRPTQIFNTQIQIQPNTVWQQMPQSCLAIVGIKTNISILQKTTLHSLDYLCSSWSSSWESDRGPISKRWAPLGLNYFVVHPAPLQPVYVNISAIAYPFTDTWPPSGDETSPFTPEFDQALQLYAASYARIKEGGNDALEGQALYRQFLEIGQRMTTIQDRRDSLTWTRSFGAQTAPSQVSHR